MGLDPNIWFHNAEIAAAKVIATLMQPGHTPSKCGGPGGFSLDRAPIHPIIWSFVPP